MQLKIQYFDGDLFAVFFISVTLATDQGFQNYECYVQLHKSLIIICCTKVSKIDSLFSIFRHKLITNISTQQIFLKHQRANNMNVTELDTH